MPITYPLPVRVAAGLLVSGVELARRLPAELPSMAVSAAGQAMRLSMKVQQNIAELAVKGDEALSLLGGAPAENPAWATFDDDLPRAAPSAAAGSAPAGAAVSAARGADLADGIAGSNGVVATELAESADDPAGAASVVDLPSRTRRRATTTGPGNTRPSKVAPTRPRATPVAESTTEEAAAEAAVEAAVEAAAEQTAEPDPSAPAVPLPEPDVVAPADDATDDASSDSIDDSGTINDEGAAGADDQATDDGGATGPLANYDSLSLAELRGHLRRLSSEQVAELVEQEQAGAARAPFLTLLENRLTSLDHDGS